MRKLLFLLLLIASTYAHALKQEDLLQPDEAFKFSAEAIAPDRIKASWDIADGYYLYRDRFNFSTETAGLKLATPEFPKGDNKSDPSFGSMEVYHKAVSVEIPVERGDAGKAVELALNVKFQGCADAGLCYPPIHKSASLQLAAADGSLPAENPVAASKSAAEALPATTGGGGKLKNLLNPAAAGGNPDEPLPPEQAFVFDMKALNKNMLRAHWTILPEHHLYRPKIKFTLKSPEGTTLGAPIFPTGTKVKDEYFGEIEVYGKNIDVDIPIQGKPADKVEVETEYQGCSDSTGVCYPPIKETTEISLAGLPETATQTADDNATASIQGASVSPNTQDEISIRMQDGSFFSTLFFFFLAGLGLAFTPCVFPMIPILSGIIAGHDDLSSRKAFWLSLAYVLPMALTYAIVGVIAGLSGANLQVIFQNPWFIGSFAGLFVLLALSMFGFYDLQMPSSIQSRLSEISNRQQGGSFIGAGIMGILSALIVGPCVTAPLIGALVYIAQTRDAFLGGMALFALGMGMGLPLLMIGTSAGRLLPRAGVWMDTTKAIFGIMMLGLSIWMLSRIVPLPVTMGLSGILLVSSGIHMGALDRLHEEVTGWNRFWKSVGLILLFYGALQLLGVSMGSSNLLQPLKGVFAMTGGGPAPVQENRLEFQKIKGIEGLEQALQEAKARNRPVMLDFYATWCVSCKELEEYTFKDPQVIALLKDAILIQADVTNNDAQDQALNKHFGIFGPPAIIFFPPGQTEESKAHRLVGYVPAPEFAKHVKDFLASGKP